MARSYVVGGNLLWDHILQYMLSECLTSGKKTNQEFSHFSSFRPEGQAQQSHNREGPACCSACSDGLWTSRLPEPELTVVSALLSG